MIIQVLLLLASAGLIVFFVTNRRTARAKAWVKIGFVVFVVFMVYGIIRPQDLTWVANQIGVGRGTDLVLYVLIVGFAFTTISTYIRFREHELRFARLARVIALQGAVLPDEAMAGVETEPGREVEAGGAVPDPAAKEGRAVE